MTSSFDLEGKCRGSVLNVRVVVLARNLPLVGCIAKMLSAFLCGARYGDANEREMICDECHAVFPWDWSATFRAAIARFSSLRNGAQRAPSQGESLVSVTTWRLSGGWVHPWLFLFVKVDEEFLDHRRRILFLHTSWLTICENPVCVPL